MSYNNENEMWHWQGQNCCLEDNTRIDISKCVDSEDHLSGKYDHFTTPVKACGDLAYQAPDSDAMEKELDECREPSSQAKRRRTLNFEPEIVGDHIFSDDMFLRSMETQDSLEDVICEMSQLVAGFSEGSSNDDLDLSSISWIADCLNDADADDDAEIHPGTENISSSAGGSAVQIDIAGLWNAPLECNTNEVKNQPVQAPQNIVFKGRKSCIRTPPKLASAIVYPFTFIKPCGMLGDTTLKDINQRILAPPKSKQDEQDESISCPTSAFSGKPVVGKTKIRTEGGEGSITIVRTKG